MVISDQTWMRAESGSSSWHCTGVSDAFTYFIWEVAPGHRKDQLFATSTLTVSAIFVEGIASANVRMRKDTILLVPVAQT